MIGKHSRSTARGSHRSDSRIIMTHVHHKTELVGQTSSSTWNWFRVGDVASFHLSAGSSQPGRRATRQSLSQSQWKRGACWYVATKLPLSPPPSPLCCFLNANEGSLRRWVEANTEPCLAPPSNKRLMSTLGNTFCFFKD